MFNKLDKASITAVAATLITLLVSTDGSRADAEDQTLVPISAQPASRYIAEPLVQPLPAEAEEESTPTQSDPAPINAANLSQLVAAQPRMSDLPRELNCLAGAIYFEAKSESLTGQLAVGRVVVARSKSGRFPNSYCGVVYQPSQFSFVRGNSMPGINKASGQWRNAVAMAQIAHNGSWRSPVEGALYFHAAYVSPGWRLTRVGRVENHIFYR